MRVFLQKGRTKPGLPIPTEAQKEVQQIQDKTTLEKHGETFTPEPNVTKVTGPEAMAPEATPAAEVRRPDDTLENGIITAEGTLVKGGQVTTKVEGGVLKDVVEGGKEKHDDSKSAKKPEHKGSKKPEHKDSKGSGKDKKKGKV